MHIFPLVKVGSDDLGDEISEIIGFQVLDSKGVVLAKGETEEEARENALTVMYLAESNEDNSRKIRLDPKMFRKKMAQRY